MLQRRLINGELLVNTLPLTFVGVVLSLNVFPAPVLVALVPVLGASLLGVSLTKLWMELVVSRLLKYLPTTSPTYVLCDITTVLSTSKYDGILASKYQHPKTSSYFAADPGVVQRLTLLLWVQALQNC